MTRLVFCLEELSAREMLKGLLPRILPSQVPELVTYLVFEGKRDLRRRLASRLRGFQDPDALFVVLCDQDSADCRDLKQELAEKAHGCPQVLIRIACHEIESWYLGDLLAVEKAFALREGLSSQQNKEKFRNPDALGNPVQELESLTSHRYQKVSGSRAIGPWLSVEENRSRSFQTFVSGLRKIVYAEDSSAF